MQKIYLRITMKNCSKFSIIIIILIISACSQKKDTANEEVKLIEKGTDIAELVQQNVKEAIEMDSIRKQLGDNSIIDFSVLQKYFPKDIVGYNTEQPTGEFVDFAGEKYSTASVHYVKNGDGDYIDIKIMDLNKAIGTYTSSVGLWAMGYSPDEKENTDEISKPTLKNSICYKRYDKLSKEAALYCGIDYRFLVEIVATNQMNTKLVQEVFDLMKLEELVPSGK